MAQKKDTEDDTSNAQEPEGRYRVESHYDSTGHKTRHFALYDNKEGLVFIFANKKSAEAVRARFAFFSDLYRSAKRYSTVMRYTILAESQPYREPLPRHTPC